MKKDRVLKKANSDLGGNRKKGKGRSESHPDSSPPPYGFEKNSGYLKMRNQSQTIHSSHFTDKQQPSQQDRKLRKKNAALSSASKLKSQGHIETTTESQIVVKYEEDEGPRPRSSDFDSSEDNIAESETVMRSPETQRENKTSNSIDEFEEYGEYYNGGDRNHNHNHNHDHDHDRHRGHENVEIDVDIDAEADKEQDGKTDYEESDDSEEGGSTDDSDPDGSGNLTGKRLRKPPIPVMPSPLVEKSFSGPAVNSSTKIEVDDALRPPSQSSSEDETMETAPSQECHTFPPTLPNFSPYAPYITAESSSRYMTFPDVTYFNRGIGAPMYNFEARSGTMHFNPDAAPPPMMYHPPASSDPSVRPVPAAMYPQHDLNQYSNQYFPNPAPTSVPAPCATDPALARKSPEIQGDPTNPPSQPKAGRLRKRPSQKFNSVKRGPKPATSGSEHSWNAPAMPNSATSTALLFEDMPFGRRNPGDPWNAERNFDHFQNPPDWLSVLPHELRQQQEQHMQHMQSYFPPSAVTTDEQQHPVKTELVEEEQDSDSEEQQSPRLERINRSAAENLVPLEPRYQNPYLYAKPQGPTVLPPSTRGHHSDFIRIDPHSGITNERVRLNIRGHLRDVTRGWNEEETREGRRLVTFKRYQDGANIDLVFQPIRKIDFTPEICTISCIRPFGTREHFVTSVDCIILLELVVNQRFSVEEKNRIRRNLEVCRPVTISKSKSRVEDFFRQIMSYDAPRPRNIEKDVKVFAWSNLEAALQKIISKYQASW